ncbi:MAG: 3-phosphoserine/phosphohydroxythreonine transaminase [Myxococcota bacterium]
MSDRVFNFSPGPAVLPEPVLEQARNDLWSLASSGIGILEQSHRGALFNRIVEEASADCRKLAGIPDSYRVLFLQGGASTQFFMVPANLLSEDRTADYLCTGSWSEKAIREAKLYGEVHIAFSSQEEGFTRVPTRNETRYSSAPAYVHFTSNNTIFGTQFPSAPVPPPGVPLICDASSDLFSRPIDITRYGLIYAGAQKNLGPAGVTLVLIHEDLLDRSVRELPTMLRYRTHADSDSRYNTPNAFGIYVVGLVFKWLRSRGGLEAMAEANAAKAKLIYDVLDASSFFRGTAQLDSRSMMNVTFRAPTEELEACFIEQAAREGLVGLKGHRSVGGMRASIYNAFPREGCEKLAGFMRDFERSQG